MFFPSLIPSAPKNTKAPDIHCLCICINSGGSRIFRILLCYMMSVFGLDNILARIKRAFNVSI